MKLESKRVLEKRGWLYDDVKDKTIVRIQDKLDGSIISFVQFPDGSIRAKSKMSFESDQAKMAQKVFNDNENIKELIVNLLRNNATPVFELVSPFNQIVLEYQNTELILLQVRDNNTGEYFDMETFLSGSVKKAENPINDFSLDNLMELKKTEKEIEGWVVTFEDGQMAKIKTEWYMNRHGLISEIREDTIIKLILAEEIDDVLSSLTPNSEKYKQVILIQEKVDKEFNRLVIEFKTLRGEYFNKYNENRKEFALKYAKKHPLFSFVMKSLNTSFRDVEKTAETGVKEYILRITNGLIKSKEWLNA